jgi:hypothetical protein
MTGIVVTDREGTHEEEDEAQIHGEALEKGGIVVAVPREQEQAEQARKVFTEAGADEVRG